jgi:hypothetical protein
VAFSIKSHYPRKLSLYEVEGCHGSHDGATHKLLFCTLCLLTIDKNKLVRTWKVLNWNGNGSRRHFSDVGKNRGGDLDSRNCTDWVLRWALTDSHRTQRRQVE